MRKVLMIAFHYPPFSGGSGILRTLKFSQYLPRHQWQPIILSANPRAYPVTEEGQLASVPQGVIVKRPFALDTARHLAFRGSYLRCFALPDRWVSWWLGAIPAGLGLVRQQHPAVIWSTFPIATAHLIGLTLHRLTGLPWIADFRDSMTEENYPREAATRRCYQWIERQATQHASYLVFTTRSTRQMYLERYPSLPPERCLIIANGYDEQDFNTLVFERPAHRLRSRPLRLVHAGVIYPDDRDPRPFFQALAQLKRKERIHSKQLRIELRASGSEEYYSTLIRDLNIADFVFLLPALPYRQALQDCADADGLLLFQAASCNHQIPAKVYEYLRLRRPIFALTAERGDTAALLREIGGATIVELADEQDIYRFLPPFLDSIRQEVHSLPDCGTVKRYARETQARELAGYLSQLVSAGKQEYPSSNGSTVREEISPVDNLERKLVTGGDL